MLRRIGDPLDQAFEHLVDRLGRQVEDARLAVFGIGRISLEHIITRRRRRGVDHVGIDVEAHAFQPLHDAQRAVAGVGEDREFLLLVLQSHDDVDRAWQGVIFMAEGSVQVEQDGVIRGKIDRHWGGSVAREVAIGTVSAARRRGGADREVRCRRTRSTNPRRASRRAVLPSGGARGPRYQSEACRSSSSDKQRTGKRR